MTHDRPLRVPPMLTLGNHRLARLNPTRRPYGTSGIGLLWSRYGESKTCLGQIRARRLLGPSVRDPIGRRPHLVTELDPVCFGSARVEEHTIQTAPRVTRSGPSRSATCTRPRSRLDAMRVPADLRSTFPSRSSEPRHREHGVPSFVTSGRATYGTRRRHVFRSLPRAGGESTCYVRCCS